MPRLDPSCGRISEGRVRQPKDSRLTIDIRDARPSANLPPLPRGSGVSSDLPPRPRGGGLSSDLPSRSRGGGVSLDHQPQAHPRGGGVSSCQALRHAVSSLYRFDDFTMEPLGSGFFSKVFKVTHKATNQIMVLKMNVNFTNRPNMLREVQLMNRLTHPNILRFLGVCVHEGQLHALTEFLDGGCLEEVLAESSRELPWALRLKLASDIAKGMRYLHSRRIIHRDLTSKNVLIRGRDQALTGVIGDFGLACKLPDPLLEKDKALPIVGSPYWMAPECIHGNIYNEKADVFSFGIILCEIIARVEADPDILPRTRHFGVDYVAFSKMIPDIPQEFLGFLHLALNCCQIDPKKRHSFSEIVNCLEELKSKSQMAAVLADINSLHLEDQESINKQQLERVLGPKRKKSSSRPPSVTIEPAKEMSPPRIDLLPDLSPAIDVENITPQVVAEYVSKQDEYYTPHRDNPFASRFKNATAKLVGSIRENWQDWFELPSPTRAHTPPATPSTPDDYGSRSLSLRLRKCHSLPESPTMMRKEFDRFHDHDMRAKCLLYSTSSIRRFEEDLLITDDSFDARSEGSSSADSAVGLDFIRKDFRSILSSPADLVHRKTSIDASMLNSSVDRYRSRMELLAAGSLRPDVYFERRTRMSRASGERPRSWLGDDFLCSTSSSESCMSLEDAFVLSPSSSYSSYSDLDSELLHLQCNTPMDARRERFQELVKVWEAKHTSGTTSDREPPTMPLLTPPPSFRPRSFLSAKDTCDFYLERVRKFQELRHKWETQQQQKTSSPHMGRETTQDVKELASPPVTPLSQKTKPT